MEEIEQSQSTEGASSEESSSSTQSTESNTTSSAAPAAEVSQKATADAPFHEHPRFKELIEQRDQFKAEMAKLRQEYESLKPKPQTEATPESKMMDRLKTIDPEFASFMKGLMDKAAKVDQLETGWQAQQAQTTQQQVSSQFAELHATNKVPAEMQEIYRRQVQAIANADPSIRVSDLPKVYAQVHQQFSQMLEARDRATKAAYVTAKKSGANAPLSANKGSTSKPGAKPSEYSKDREIAKGQLVAKVMSNLRATAD